MDESFNITIEGFEEIKTRLMEIDIQKLESKTTSAVAIEFDNIARKNIIERIYNQPQSAYYVRTGAAKGGSVIQNFEDGKGLEVIWNSTLKSRSIEGVDGVLSTPKNRVRSGQRQLLTGKDHTIFLNENSRVKRLNTYFFTDAIKEIKTKALSIQKAILESLQA